MRKTTLPGDTERTVPAGDYIVRQGDEAVDMFVIRFGDVEISRQNGEGKTVLATLGRGDFFGEMSLLESLPREANALALTDTTVLVITQGGLLMRLRRDPTFALEMLHALSRRIRTMNERLDAEESDG